MGVRDQHMRDGLAANRIEQRRRVLLIVGTGIDNRDLALPYNVTHRPGEGERAGVIAENPPNAGSHLVDYAGLERKVAVERDVIVVGHGILSDACARKKLSSYPAKAG